MISWGLRQPVRKAETLTTLTFCHDNWWPQTPGTLRAPPGVSLRAPPDLYRGFPQGPSRPLQGFPSGPLQVSTGVSLRAPPGLYRGFPQGPSRPLQGLPSGPLQASTGVAVRAPPGLYRGCFTLCFTFATKFNESSPFESQTINLSGAEGAENVQHRQIGRRQAKMYGLICNSCYRFPVGNPTSNYSLDGCSPPLQPMKLNSIDYRVRITHTA